MTCSGCNGWTNHTLKNLCFRCRVAEEAARDDLDWLRIAKGVGTVSIAKLRAAGFTNLQEIIDADPFRLEEVVGHRFADLHRAAIRMSSKENRDFQRDHLEAMRQELLKQEAEAGGVLSDISRAVRECFPDRAEQILSRVVVK